MNAELLLLTKSAVCADLSKMVKFDEFKALDEVAISSVRRIYQLDVSVHDDAQVFAEVVLPLFTMKELCVLRELIEIGQNSYQQFILQEDTQMGNKDVVWSLVEGLILHSFNSEMYGDEFGVERLEFIQREFRRLSQVDR